MSSWVSSKRKPDRVVSEGVGLYYSPGLVISLLSELRWAFFDVASPGGLKRWLDRRADRSTLASKTTTGEARSGDRCAVSGGVAKPHQPLNCGARLPNHQPYHLNTTSLGVFRWRRGGLLLAAIVGWREAGFFAEELREVAGVGVADVVGDGDYALFCFAQEAPRGVHAEPDLIL